MLFTVTYNLDRIHCNEVVLSSKEPYLWTVFFYVDIDSIDVSSGSYVVVHVPREGHTLRSDFPDVEAGDDVSIPSSIGSHTMVLDDGAQANRALAGMFVLLLEQNGTDGDAIRAGHGVLGEAVEAALDGYIQSKLFEGAVPAPTDAEIQAMADQIETDVKDAITEASDFWDYFDGRDYMVGFGYQFLLYDQLLELAAREEDPELSFSFHVEHQRPFKIGQLTIEFIDNYDIFGTVQVRTPASFFGVREELDGYLVAVEVFNNANQTIADLLDQLRKASPDRRQPLVAELKFQRDVVRRQASKDLGYARAQYASARNRVCPARADYLDDKTARREKRMQRLSRGAPSRFYRAANVVPSNTLDDRCDESNAETEQ